MWDKELILQRDLAAYSSEQLRTMLREETEKDVPDDDLVLTILHILEDREPDLSETGSAREEAAWKLYRKRIQARRTRRLPYHRNLLRVASAVLAVCLLFALVPQQAEADNWWQRLTKWTDEFFGFFREDEALAVEAYAFQTDNPGLQQVYDAVVEMGITIPAVPMWLPEGYQLEELTTVSSRIKEYVYARFLSGDQECVLKINVLHGEAAKDYFKNDIDVQEHEKNGMRYSLVQNQNAWIASWTKDNIEGALAIDCPEKVLHEIISSIYKGRTNE